MSDAPVDHRAFGGSAQLSRIEKTISEIALNVRDITDAINGEEKRGIEGLRPRIRKLEAENILLQAEIENLKTERKVIKGWLIGLAAGLAVAGGTGFTSLLLQLAKLGVGAP